MYFALAVAIVLASQVAGAKSPPEPHHYTVYWLSKPGGDSEYRMLLITRLSLRDLAKWIDHRDLGDRLRAKGDPGPQLLDQMALTIATNKKDSIWNDGIPLKPLTQFKEVNERNRTVEVDWVQHHIEECPLADVVRLLKAPEGKEPLHRLHPPLGGMEQTARALRLLLEEQLKDESKKR